jgi:UDP-glucose 4-epimerase
MLAADARLAAAGADAAGPYNVGTGVETSVLDLVERLGRIGGRSDFEAEMAPERPGEVQRIALDSARAADELGWSSSVDLDDGLRRTLDAVDG